MTTATETTAAPESIIRWYRDGLITHEEMAASLDLLQVRGGFDSAGQFTGYDYRAQHWIVA